VVDGWEHSIGSSDLWQAWAARIIGIVFIRANSTALIAGYDDSTLVGISLTISEDARSIQ
jgi:hypothetical protein